MDATQQFLLMLFGSFGLSGVLALASIVLFCSLPNGAARWTLLVVALATLAASFWNFALMRADIAGCERIAMFVSPKDPQHDASVALCFSAQHLQSRTAGRTA